MKPVLIMTRPAHVAQSAVADYRAAIAQPFDVVMSPLLEIVPCDVPPFNADPDHVIFTSANAVAQVDRIGLSRRGIAWCVGQRTADAATKAGFTARTVQGTGRDLLDLIKTKNVSGTFLHVHGRETYVNFAEALGDRCEGICVYDQVIQPPNAAACAALTGKAPVIIPLYSARTAITMTTNVQMTAPVWLVGIGADIFSKVDLPDATFGKKIAATPDHKGMILATRLVFEALAMNASP